VSKYINIGAIQIGGIGLLWPGQILDDQYDDIARIEGAGATLWPYSDATVLAAAVVVNNQRSSGIDINAAQTLMVNATLVSISTTATTAAASAAASASDASDSAADASTALLHAGLGIYGDGNDGVCDFDGTSVVLGLTPSSRVYTLTRDIYLADGSAVAALAFIKTAGFRVFCNGTLTIAATGGIHNNGNAGAAGTAGTGGAAGATTSTAGTLGAGAAGGAGGSGNSAGSAGGASAIGFPGGTGIGGAGGGDGTHTGAVAGAFTALVAGKGGGRHLLALITGQLFGAQTNDTASLLSLIGGGSGGGGGCGDDADAGGGGGGGGAGYLMVAAYDLVVNGTITCTGGAGGLSVSAAHNAGGGGGGGGGVAITIARSRSGLSSGPSAAGGAGGAKAGASGVAGSAGAVGTVIELYA
jgi:hypothetical protein